MKNSTKLKLSEPAMALYERGTASLSNMHLISSIGGVSMETSRAILRKAVDLENLASWNINNFMQFTGVGINKAAALVSAFELGRRRTFSNSGTRYKINSSKDAYDYVRPYLLDQEIEHFYCLLLNRANRIIKAELISSGGTSGTVVDAKIVFKIALEFKASALILSHNHPSGHLKPSNNDINLTKLMAQAGKTLSMPVLDHIIFTNEGYFSFADEGMI